MKRLVAKYKNTPYEKRLVITTVFTMCVSSAMALSKIILGLFSDYTLCAVGVFNILLMTAKLSCVLGVKKNVKYDRRNAFTAIFLFFAGLIYTAYMFAAMYFDFFGKYTMFVSIALAAFAFTELGIAIYGLVKTKRREHYYRNIKIISFASALTAIMTAQIALLGFGESGDYTYINSYSGMAIGAVTMLLAVYIYFAPQISAVGREHNVFRLADPAKNNIINMSENSVKLTLKHSRVYGEYVFAAEIKGDVVDGNIEKHNTFWKRLPLVVKILFIILSEILVFVYAVGYAVWFVRTVDMPAKLNKLLSSRGFTLIPKPIVISTEAEKS